MVEWKTGTVNASFICLSVCLSVCLYLCVSLRPWKTKGSNEHDEQFRERRKSSYGVHGATKLETWSDVRGWSRLSPNPINVRQFYKCGESFSASSASALFRRHSHQVCDYFRRKRRGRQSAFRLEIHHSLICSIRGTLWWLFCPQWSNKQEG